MKTYVTLLSSFTLFLCALPAATLELSALNGTNGFRLDGIAANDYSVSDAGDVNGDGFEDMLIGAPGGGTNGASLTCLVFGKAAGFTATNNLSTLDGTTGFVFHGAGASISTAGDVNGDGYDDILIGGGASPGGQSYLVFGGPTNLAALDIAGGAAADGAIALSALNGLTGFIFNGATNDQAGAAISGAGDANGDGYEDFLIGAPTSGVGGANSGAAYLIFGGTTNLNALTNGAPGTINLGLLSGTGGLRIGGAAAGDQLGRALRAAGDVNGDGYKDIILGAPYADTPTSDAGRAYVVFGRVSWPSNPSITNLLTAGSGAAFAGGATDLYTGQSVSGAGDVNGDGFDDVIIGTDPPSPGRARVLFGRADGLLPANGASLTGANGFTLTNIAANAFTGRSVSAAGDANDDGLDDLLVGAFGADPNGASSGQSYVVYGKTNAFPASVNLATLAAADGFPINGVAANDRSGFPVGTAGDVNGDGFGDVLISAIRSSAFRQPHAYVVFGGDFTASVTHSGDANTNTLTGTAGANVMNGKQANDLLAGLGGADVLYGAQGDDILAISDTAFRRLAGGRGFDTLRLDGAGLVLSLTNIPDNRVTGIEQIDLGDSSTNTLTISRLEVLNLSGHSNTLLVRGDADDTLNLDAGWAGAGLEVIGGETFRVFVQGAAIVKVECGVAVPAAPSVLSVLAAAHGTSGITLDGAASGDFSGSAVAGAGDVNGDGYDDVIVGAPEAGGTGRAYVFFGDGNWTSMSRPDLAALNGVQGFVLRGVDAGDKCGAAVSGGGDINGDGFDDLVIGAPVAAAAGNALADAGESYVVFGGPHLAALDVADGTADGSIALANLATGAGTNGFTLFGVEVDGASGTAVSVTGDVNADGFADVLVGAPNRVERQGKVFVLFGHGGPFTPAMALAGLLATNGGNGTAGIVLFGQQILVDDGMGGQFDTALDMVGISVSIAGDVNGDGRDDMLIGSAHNHIPMGAFHWNALYLVFGRTNWLGTPSVDLGALGGTNGFMMFGQENNDATGRAVSGAGDVNGDGFDDLIVGGGTGTTDTYILFGKATWSSTPVQLATLNGSGGFIFRATTGAVSGAGDVNHDGLADVLIGGLDETDLIHGRTNWTGLLQPADLDGVLGLRIVGADPTDQTGIAVGNAGDFNGDTYGDIIIGANYGDAANDARPEAGESYVLFGGRLLTCAAPTDSDGDDISDAWELTYTNNLTTLTATGDADGDGNTDYEEYVADTGPLDPADVFRITAVTLSPDGLTTTLTWTSKPTRRYRVVHTTDLAQAFTTALDNIVPDAGTTTTRAITHASATARFFRVAVYLPPAP